MKILCLYASRYGINPRASHVILAAHFNHENWKHKNSNEIMN